ncbi:MAG: mechanosensitive ion channel family protein [Acidobacteriota bacterium]
MGRATATLLPILLALLVACLIFSWTTRDATSLLQLRNSRGPGSLVDTRTWQTAQELASLAVSAEEDEYARQAEHLADHEVDQAFAAALREAGRDAQHRALTGHALVIKLKIDQLRQMQKQDQALVDRLSAKAVSSPGSAHSANAALPAGADLQVAEAQLGLDNDEIADAERDLARATGDRSLQIQEELAAHEQSMRKYDAQVASGETAVVSISRNRTLAARIAAWFQQRQRESLIEQARQQALSEAGAILAQHNALEAKADAAVTAAGTDHEAQLASLKERSIEREILSIDDDRIQTDQQLAEVYGKWAAQVLLQHRLVLHLVLSSVIVILAILIAMLICDAVVRHFMDRHTLDRRRMRTLRNVLELGIQVLGIGLVLLVVFGAPRQTTTMLGLATAALTIALQDYIISFLGWFALIGKNGIHVGDWIEINGVCGEVIEVRLMTTTLLETGTLAEQGSPTGRRITLMNSFAIRGQYFNFSTAGQWMWDEIEMELPDNVDIQATALRLQQFALQETEQGIQVAEQEWRQAAHGQSLSRFSAAPVVNLRPSGAAIQLQLRYVTSAADRFELRNRLYRRAVELIHEQDGSKPPDPGAPAHA